MSPDGDARVRRLAARALDQALAPGAPPAGADPDRRRLERRDRNLLQELVQGALRWKARLDHVIVSAAGRPMERIDEALHSPLRLAAYQLLFLDRIPGYAAVSEAVDEARRRLPRGAGFVNAVLRRISRAPRLDDWPVEVADPTQRLAIETSHPRFLVERWTRRLGAERARAVLDAGNRRPALQLLAFRDRGGRAELARRLAEEGVETDALELSSLGLEVAQGDPLTTAAYRAGDVYIQDQASQAAALIPQPRAGERVLDAAAAPGGKSFALLASEPAARVTAADVGLGRLVRLRDNAHRLRRRLAVLACDAGSPALPAGFDRVIVDLPCSGTGILARHPDLRWRLTESEIGRLAGEGHRLLAGAADAVAAGGLLIAITCSIEPEENEAVVARLADTRPDLKPVDLAELLEPPLRDHVFAPGAWRVLPGPRNDGFTVHVLRRSGTGESAGGREALPYDSEL